MFFNLDFLERERIKPTNPTNQNITMEPKAENMNHVPWIVIAGVLGFLLVPVAIAIMWSYQQTILQWIRRCVNLSDGLMRDIEMQSTAVSLL